MPRDLFKNRLPGISHDDLGFYSLNHIFISSSRKVAYRRKTLYVLWSHIHALLLVGEEGDNSIAVRYSD
jgi:hypothetical protein